MAGKADIEAGRAFVKLSLKDELKKKLHAAIGNAREELNNLKAPGALKALQEEITKLKLSQTVLGRMGGMIDKAREGMKRFADLAGTVGTSLAAAGAAITGALVGVASGHAAVAQKLSMIHRIIAYSIAPAVMPVVDQALQLAQIFGKWAVANQKTLTLILRIGVGLIAAGAAFKVIAIGARGLVVALHAARMAILAINIIITTTWAGPLLLMLGTLVAIGAVAYKMHSGFRYFFNQSMADTQSWATNIKRSIASIGNALMSGNLAIAFKVALKALEVEWVRFQNNITKGWLSLVSWIGRIPLAPGFHGAAFGAWIGRVRKLFDDLAADSDDRLKAAIAELNGIRIKADKALGDGGAIGIPFTPKFSTTAAGAVSLGAGVGSDSIAAKSYSELQQIKKAQWEAAKLMREMAARRERPGVFGK